MAADGKGAPERPATPAGTMPTVDSLHELTAMVLDDRDQLFVRWSRGPRCDMQDVQSSRDELTGVPMPGLSANPLTVESWWGGRPPALWVARRLHDYRHLRELRGPGVRPWVLVGRTMARGPDNEPLVECLRPVAWIADAVIDEAEKLVEDQDNAGTWGPLDRSS
jgi:hypothetical protein